MTIDRLLVLLTLVAGFVPAGAWAQGSIPELTPKSTTAPTSSFPTNGAAPVVGVPDTDPPACTDGFLRLRQDAEIKGKLIEAASDRHAPPDESCKVIGSYSEAEVKIIKYVEANAAKCGIPVQVADQLKAGHKNTEGLLQKVCGIAERIKARGAPGQISDFGDPAFRPRAPRGPVGDFDGSVRDRF
jgi:hypothetical protein